WRLSMLDKVSLISNSDSHSPQKIGREANVFETELSFKAITEAIKNKNPKEFLYTIEFFPEEGKYHFDGHRLCGVKTSPVESKKYNNICPVCNKPLVIGVLNRVEELADRPEGFAPPLRVPFKNLIPLSEIIVDVLECGPINKRVNEQYVKLIQKFGTEFSVLLNASLDELKTATLPEIAEGIIKVREGKVSLDPGYDGVYGKINISKEKKEELDSSQSALF
ncbi:MAG: endonuclease Q family protein, partial [Candidatus Nealsonbacteria bacterium]|nr:endonuclease Q family protein [Candidatus Nealsonbacteria bacterium]